MAFDLKRFGDKIRNYREQLSLEVIEISEKTGINLERLIALEGGKLEPTGDEILIFSDFFKQDYNFFISNEQKNGIEQVDILYRKHGNDFSKEDRWAIREFLFLCESEQFIFDSLQIRKVEFDFTPFGPYFKSHGKQGASALRERLNLADNQIIPNPYQIFRQLGVHIFRRKLRNSNISGLFINHPVAGKCILVNYNEDIFRQNFTLAHEMGHAIFDYDKEINVSFENGSWSKSDLSEIRANSFASHFLIPKSIFRGIDFKNITEKQLTNLAMQIQVNVEPLLISLKNGNLISYDQKQSFRSLKIHRNDKLDPELKGISEKYYSIKLKLLERGLSDFYVKNCYEAYSRGLISSGRLADILLCNERELNDIMSLFNLKLSYDN